MPMSAARSSTLVIVPAWNEGESVGPTVREIRAQPEGWDILVVDDGSHDDTAQRAREAGATILSLPFNLGVGGAMRAGFRYAQRHGYTRAIQVDADGQHNPRDIAAVLDGLESADISIGARFADVGDYAARGPRWWAMRMLATVLSRIAGTRLTDVTSGFRAANVRAIDQYVVYYPAEYLGDTVDSLVNALHAGLTVVQVPVAMRPRAAGRPSQNPFGAAVYLLRSVFALSLAMMRGSATKTGVSA
ncbi:MULTISPECIES: glycosyltransferase family 2 protein [unclassified Microbacterium]|uniref:glycosyltransferase family 2 protein n=1 Tax=unclassified Microbacterium TaxID=2609290 RepID=UPI0006F887D7|nr:MULTISPECIES: glycosyltransferase family 2 protein [unclassified Microbacterium]KQT74251.1 glycosyl transferase family 2 [Microbacterium sp. Leaf436]MBD8205406.1 glycosyltransferase family 2 protein [Microbacterium sp. CFBP 8801]MBD8219119.1 glycosyltransferase family 2 protein [Microbacterium sp. CFBP 13617]MBD8478467.1 glycosyltransferase family 2 protein [Microbacterium sp. CFBP 8794]MBD8508259.1 glycosyltransferase family 2 protein [Microbacterium sp. CFBP 8790]